MTVLGHVQRGGTPTAYDRVLATRFGVAAADAVAAGDFGKMVALRGTEIERVSHRTGAGRAQAAGPGAVRDRGGVLRVSGELERMRRDYAGALAAAGRPGRHLAGAAGAVARRGGSGRAARAERHGAGHRRRGRRPQRPHRAAQGPGRSRAHVLHQPALAQGPGAVANARAAVVFPWIALHRQVVVDGPMEVLDAAASDEYFGSRPHGAQLAAAASDQSHPVASRADLEAAYRRSRPATRARSRARTLGRAASAPGRGRGVLAGTARSPARPASLPPHGGRVGRGAAGALNAVSGRRPRGRGSLRPS